MVRWRCAVVLAMLLLLPAKAGSKPDDEETEEDRNEEGEEDDDDEEEEEEEDSIVSKEDRVTAVRRPVQAPAVKPPQPTRAFKKRPLECFVCAYKSETPLRACLDPSKYRVHTITCHSVEDKCFTTVMSKSNSYEAVVRGCRSGCVGSPETTCCELNRCNNQAFTLPTIPPQILTSGTSTKSIPPTILFFVTVLLVLQTVVKVAFV